MIRKLRIKFIAISMTSTIIVLFLILGSINLLNYREMSHNADTILDFEYSYAAEPPVQFRLSHLSRRSEPL